ncbi:hypothetical protein CTA1_749 [Colletotrichum tanaceti]|uniref:Uncharacterized protein n=1 Tax=Colletotrichum tanaceti TaxID=1306861 RepID=A0A4U6XQJ3_9PEZI|nr:hypothetical protein CTA1_749 [Colletotrichum tanaceti]
MEEGVEKAGGKMVEEAEEEEEEEEEEEKQAAKSQGMGRKRVDSVASRQAAILWRGCAGVRWFPFCQLT